MVGGVKAIYAVLLALVLGVGCGGGKEKVAPKPQSKAKAPSTSSAQEANKTQPKSDPKPKAKTKNPEPKKAVPNSGEAAAIKATKHQAKTKARVDGVVSNIDTKYGFIRIDIGEEHDAKNGDYYKVIRGGEQLGTIVVVAVRGKSVFCKQSEPLTQLFPPIKKGDSVMKVRVKEGSGRTDI